MFQFTGFAWLTPWHTFNMSGCPIRISADHKLCAPPRSFSQLITSFFASESLGIPHTPFSSLSLVLLILILNKYYHINTVANLSYFTLILLFVFLCDYNIPEDNCNSLCPNMSMNIASRDRQLNYLCTHMQYARDKLLSPGIARWRISESNRWPPACKAGALASWANPPITSS